MKTLLNYSYVKATESDGIVSCIYRGTEIIRLNNNTNTIILNTGGWYTNTTKKYINKFLPSKVGVSQSKGLRYIHEYQGVKKLYKSIIDNPITILGWTINVIN